jgi:hypothetical protein
MQVTKYCYIECGKPVEENVYLFSGFCLTFIQDASDMYQIAKAEFGA